MTTNKRYFKNGKPVPADEALDLGGVLKDGYSTSVPTRLRDSASNKLHVTDALGQHGENGSANRAGWRLPSNPYLKDQTEVAYGHEEYLRTAYLGDRRSKKTKYSRSGDIEGTEEIEEENDDVRDADGGASGVSQLGVPPEGSACVVRGPEYPLDQGSAGVIRGGTCVPIAPKTAVNVRQDALTADKKRKQQAVTSDPDDENDLDEISEEVKGRRNEQTSAAMRSACQSTPLRRLIIRNRPDHAQASACGANGRHV